MISALVAAGLAWGAPAPQRHAVVVGANAARPGSAPLRYGHDDARRLAATLEQVGGFAAEDITVLLDPTPSVLLQTVEQALSGAAPQDLFLLYYSGHGGDDALYPSGRALDVDALRQIMEDSRVAVRVGILDVCRGGSWTGAKGLVELESTFAPPLSVHASGSVLLASSTGTEDAHEGEVVGGSFFTHHLVAGLRGAADDSGDGSVTVSEAFRYAKHLTVRDAATYTDGAQHPSYRIDLSGRHDLVLSRLDRAPSELRLDQQVGPLQVVQLETGILVLELPRGPRQARLALPAGAYLVRQSGGSERASATVWVQPDETVSLAEGDLVPSGAQRAAAKGIWTGPQLPRGAWSGGGHVVPVQDAELTLDLAALWFSSTGGGMRLELVHGVSDHVQWLAPGTLAVHLGGADAVDALVWGGVHGLDSGGAVSLEVNAATGAEGRLELTPWLSLGASGVLSGGTPLIPDLDVGRSSVDLRLTSSVRVGHIELHPAVALRWRSYSRVYARTAGRSPPGVSWGPPQVLLFDAVRSGRHLPLVRWYLTPGAALDLSGKALMHDDGTADVLVFVGTTLTSW